MAGFAGDSNNQNLSTKQLKRIGMMFMGKEYKFALNPESYDQTGPGKVNVTHTKAGAYLETFGAGISEITFSGHTGLRNGGTDPEAGFRKFKELKDLIDSVYAEVVDGREVTDFLEFYNYTDQEYFYTYPDKFDLKRTSAKPLLYRYEVHLWCIRPLWQPETTVNVVGSPYGVESTYNDTLDGAGNNTTTNVLDPTAEQMAAVGMG